MPKPKEAWGKKEKRTKFFYEHGKDGLALALSVAELEEGKTLQKMEKRRQAEDIMSWRKAGDKRSRLEETKAIIAKRRAQAKKEKAKSRRDQLRSNQSSTSTNAPDTELAPRKRVSFA